MIMSCTLVFREQLIQGPRGFYGGAAGGSLRATLEDAKLDGLACSRKVINLDRTYVLRCDPNGAI